MASDAPRCEQMPYVVRVVRAPHVSRLARLSVLYSFFPAQWPAEVKRNLEGSNKYMKKLLECSPYPLCLFNFNGHLITCNPAAVAVFGNTIWLQSDIFGMSERERCGLDPDQLKNHSASFTIERTERCTAYEAMMEALVEDGSSYQTDLMIRRRGGSGAEEFWYCRVFAQRHKDPHYGRASHYDLPPGRDRAAQSRGRAGAHGDERQHET